MDITLTESQERVFSAIKDFLRNDNPYDIFILKGYAGTGKTTLASFVLKYLQERNLKSIVMAPTGRAAKVIESKVGKESCTIHSAIYKNSTRFLGINSPMPLKSYYIKMNIDDEPRAHALIIDESSMISDIKTDDRFLKVDSSLLCALFKFTEVNRIPKILFIGDGAQLPPVRCDVSYALDADYLRRNYGKKVMGAELTEVLRQKDDSGILKEAMEMRLSLKVSQLFQREHTIEPNGDDILQINPNDIPAKYCELFPRPMLGQGVVISFTNRDTVRRNRQIREILFGCDPPLLVVGDIILIYRNTLTDDIALHNGDFAQIIELEETSETRDVLVEEKQKTFPVSLVFRKAKLLMEDGEVVSVFLLENIFKETEGGVPYLMIRALYIDFCARNRQSARPLKEGSKDFKFAFIDDPWVNCVCAKHGYAITCHKSQGGEWDTVFVDYSKKNGKRNDDIRWAYTATTRAKKKLYIVNPPENRSMAFWNQRKGWI